MDFLSILLLLFVSFSHLKSEIMKVVWESLSLRLDWMILSLFFFFLVKLFSFILF